MRRWIKLMLILAIFAFLGNVYSQFETVPVLKVKIYYEEGFMGRVKSVVLFGLEGEGEDKIYQVSVREGEQSLIVGIKPGKYLVNVIFEGEEEGNIGLSYSLWDLIDGLAEMRLENTVEVLARGSSYLTLYVGEGRGIGGAFKLKGGKETEILWLKWPESMLRRRAEKLKKLLKGPRISSGEEVCSFWDGSCEILLDVQIKNFIDCEIIKMSSPEQEYCFKAQLGTKKRCVKISDGHEGRALGLTSISMFPYSTWYGNIICENINECKNSKKCSCAVYAINAIVEFQGKILVLSKKEYCKIYHIPPNTEKCNCVYDSMLAHENYHCEYGKKLIKGEVGKLKERLKEAIKEFCEKEKKAPICSEDADCKDRLNLSLSKELKSGWKEVGGDLDEEGAIKEECKYQQEHHCVLPKCKKGGDRP